MMRDPARPTEESDRIEVVAAVQRQTDPAVVARTTLRTARGVGIDEAELALRAAGVRAGTVEQGPNSTGVLSSRAPSGSSGSSRFST